MTRNIQTLGEVLNSIGNFQWNHVLYLAGAYPWTSDTIAIVLDASEIEDVEQPKLVEQYELWYALDIQTIQSIVEGARQQVPEPSVQFLIDSFNYYWKYDAFLRLT